MEMWRFLILFLSVANSQNCEKSKFILQYVDDWYGVSVVFYSDFPCDPSSHPYYLFCEDSGWGNEEATVACREFEKGKKYGIGGYITVQSSSSGYGNIECKGSETKLEDCTVRKDIRPTCSSTAAVIYCFTDQIQVFIVQHPPEVQEGDTIEVCLQTTRIVTEPLYFHIETTTTKYTPAAIAGYDYKISTSTLKFEPFDGIIFDGTISQQQCLEIEIIDDSLPEDWEVFTLLLSTNNSAVDLVTDTVIVEIMANNGSSCFEGNVTVVSDVDSNSFQLVEMCSSEGVWSPVCDNNWTLHDAMVVCRELHNQDIAASPVYAVVNNSMGSGSVSYECEGNETRLSDCVRPLKEFEAPCYYALVKCFSTTDKGPGGSTTSTTSGGSSAGIVAGLVGSLVAVLLVVTIVIIIIIVWLKRRDKNLKPAAASITLTTTSPQSQTSVTGGTGASNMTSLGNPTYQIQPGQTNGSGTPEHKFINPLYSAPTEAGVKRPYIGSDC